jgi:hypothetical protein
MSAVVPDGDWKAGGRGFVGAASTQRERAGCRRKNGAACCAGAMRAGGGRFGKASR